MSEIWAAAVGAVISTGLGVAANAALAPGFGGAAPVKFNPIDVGDVNQQAIDFSKLGYNLSDADLAKRLPGLVSGNDTEINDAYKQLNGPLDPVVQNAFTRNALESTLASTGGGDSTASVGGVGSASGNSATATIANEVNQKQDQDRSNLENLLAENPERTFGIGGSGALGLTIGNAQNENQYNVGKYQYQTQKAASPSGHI